MAHYVKKIIVIVCLLALASTLWWPLIKWNHLFKSAPAVEFTVPVFEPLQFS